MMNCTNDILEKKWIQERGPEPPLSEANELKSNPKKDEMKTGKNKRSDKSRCSERTMEDRRDG